MIASTALGHTEPGIVPLCWLREMSNVVVDNSFLQVKGFPLSSLVTG